MTTGISAADRAHTIQAAVNSKVRPTQTALAYRLFRAFYNWLSEHDVYKDLVVEYLLATKKVKSNVPESCHVKYRFTNSQNIHGGIKA